ncbi:uncharacterized protein LOC113531182 [Pangasianodon hypophthalmus]|uniref:uncharacterized protein LOC113531182 n=1 Tax=Pangasianodon hypophthalmus TaxID=310915 RepID=UPI0023078942|nr:uncharacterized protein LOC113531182 [Pangasianodon hypophthalmus]XP_053086564.1 uncharacterized protein LOC113531182 [Pangasianodon hypophthalmus]XP_053086565.1 uncharacterized protein LOC113531182 [Pangasianodon hypophthalmus]
MADNPDDRSQMDQSQSKNTAAEDLQPCMSSENTTKQRKIAHVLSGSKYFILQTGKTLNSHEQFIIQLKNKIPRLQKVDTEKECDFILVFCPVVSRAGTDIEEAMKKLYATSATKPAVLVVLHHTFNPELIVPDSSRAVNRENVITVDCLFHEDQGLLPCKKNYDVINHIEMQMKPQILNTGVDWRGLLGIKNSNEQGCSSQMQKKGMKDTGTVNRKGLIHRENSNEQGSSSQLCANQKIPEYEQAFEILDKEIKQLEMFEKEELGKELKSLMTTDFSELIFATELRLVLLGRSGSGKTAAQNTILGREERNQAATSEATSTATSTATQQSETTQGEVAGRKVIVVDTPDWFTSGLFLEKLRQDEGLRVHLSAPGPLVFLLVIPIKHSQDTEVYKEEVLEETLLKMAEIFGKRFWGNIMILFTVTEDLQNIAEFIQSGDQEVQRLVQKCGNRFHCLNIKERGDDSQVSELLEKIEKMVEGNRNGTEVYQIIRDMERERHSKDAWIREVQHQMQETLEKYEQYIKAYEHDEKDLGTDGNNAKMISKLKRKYELKRDIGNDIKKMYDRVAGLEENRQFIKVLLPENQQPIWLSLPGEQPKNPEKHKELTQLEEWFSVQVEKLHSNKKTNKQIVKNEDDFC